ncbi:MAG TPA: hypothetical protein VHC45_16550 [Gaiellaceae bacterium]|nr:hypothetical protein [Gaiellaceae bacterium]
MAETVLIELPRPGLRDELCESLAAHGFQVEVVGERAEPDGTAVELRVGYADAHARLLAETALALEDWLAARELPLVVERANGGCLLRPPGD